jgi:protein O-GlcNAc transferase
MRWLHFLCDDHIGDGSREVAMPETDNSRLRALQAKFEQGVAQHQQGKLADAECIYREVLQRAPNHFGALHLLGVIALQTHHTERAVELIRKAIGLDDKVAAAHYNLGNALSDLKRPEEALASYNRSIVLKPDHAEANYNHGNALRELNRPAEAIASYERAIALKFDYTDAHTNRGNALRDLRRPEEALASYDRAIALKPEFAEAHNNRGNALQDLKRPEEALASYDRAIALKPDFAEAHNNRGVALQDLKRPEEALASCDKAIILKPDYAEAHNNRGNALNDLKRHEEAGDAYAEVLKIDPEYPFTKGRLLHQKMLSCDWKGVDELIAEIDRDVASGKLSAEPFGWQGVAKSERSLQLCAELYNRHEFSANIRISTRHQLDKYGKIRIGYSSGEFRQQATSFLLVGVLEHHDNTQFEIYAFDNGWDDKSEIRRRINAAVHRIIDISQLSDSSAVDAICENQIDILVNLNGYFGKERTRMFSQRAAPIQVNYLGFPGTSGASYIDYIIADQDVVPPNHKEFYTEKVVYLPNCYQANDSKRKIGTRIFSRVECGLPQNGFVFCCFNNNYKITPHIFDHWMRMLKRVEGSVLWLLEDNAAATSNLRKEAVARGVDEHRLIFAPRMPLPDHLARHRLADLFLDTLPYNAHTTASDALWAGLPVLTCLGKTFAGRVAASLLNAIGLPELITTTFEEYERKAIDLATHPEKLAIIKRKLAENRLTTPLFDTKLFTKHIEAAYMAMYARHHAGLSPDHIHVVL